MTRLLFFIIPTTLSPIEMGNVCWLILIPLKLFHAYCLRRKGRPHRSRLFTCCYGVQLRSPVHVQTTSRSSSYGKGAAISAWRCSTHIDLSRLSYPVKAYSPHLLLMFPSPPAALLRLGLSYAHFIASATTVKSCISDLFPAALTRPPNSVRIFEARSFPLIKFLTETGF
jgi:hypothetical protein